VLRSPIVDTRFSVFCDVDLPSHKWKDTAGNAFHVRIAGALGMFVLANLVRREVDIQRPIMPSADLDASDDEGPQPVRKVRRT